MMPGSSFAPLSMFFLLSAGCTQPVPELSAGHAAAIRDSVTTTLEAFRRYSAARQWDSLTAIYAAEPGFRWLENGEVRYRSGAEIRQALSGVPATTRIVTSYQDTEILAIAPGIASVNTRFQTQFLDSTTAPFSFGGAITMTLVHRPEGWRIIAGHTSAPVPRRQ
jgi:SnoaL-like domain